MKIKFWNIQILTAIICILSFSGCVKKDEITSDSFLFTMLSATIDTDEASEGVIVNLRIYLEAELDTPIDSFSIWSCYTDGAFDPADANNFRKATRTGNPGPGYFTFPVNLQLFEPRNFGLCAYSKGVLYKTRAVNLLQLLKNDNHGEVAAYKFNGSADDEYGAYDLQMIGVSSFVLGYSADTKDQAISFVNSALQNDFLDQTVAGTSGRTFSFKVFYTGGNPFLFAYGDAGAGEFSAQVNGTSQSLVIKAGNSTFELNDGALSPGVWHKVVVKIPANATENRLRTSVDANQDSGSGTSQVNTSSGNGFYIGAGPFGANSANNLIIDDFVIWDRSLSFLAVKILTGD